MSNIHTLTDLSTGGRYVAPSGQNSLSAFTNAIGAWGREVDRLGKEGKAQIAKHRLEQQSASMAKRPRNGALRGATSVATRGPTRTLVRTVGRRTKRPRVFQNANVDSTRWAKRYRGLTRRRRRRYRRRKTSSYDKSWFPFPPSVQSLSQVVVGNMPFCHTARVVNPLAVLTRFSPTSVNNFAHINLMRVGAKLELVNPYSFTVFVKLIFGRVKSNSTNAMVTYAATIPPQVNNHISIKAWSTFWDRLYGKRVYTLSSGARVTASIGAPFGLRRMDSTSSYTSVDDRVGAFCYYLVAWPEVCYPPGEFATETSLPLSYPNMKFFSFVERPFIYASYPENLARTPTEIVSTMTDLTAVINTVEVKAEDVMTSAKT